MSEILDTMSDHHKKCDDLQMAMEKEFHEKSAGALERLEKFIQAMTSHFIAEEEVLFPALESVMGGQMGPTMMMRMEHQQMLGVLNQMKEAKDKSSEVLNLSESLLMLIQQHNMKEENVLYPLCDRALEREASEIVNAIESRLVV